MLKGQELLTAAHEAGMVAGRAAKVVGMRVGTAMGLVGNAIDPSKPVYDVPEGPCGFAWVNISPATQPFARFTKKIGVGRKAYYGGRDIACHEFNQSIQRKEKYCYAFARVLKDNGVTCYNSSRMD
jgi:hypothetical protein